MRKVLAVTCPKSTFSFPSPVYKADFNEDGQVDSQDLALWQGGFGTLADATKGQGDNDTDADVDGAHLLSWQQQLGSSIPAVSASTGVLNQRHGSC